MAGDTGILELEQPASGLQVPGEAGKTSTKRLIKSNPTQVTMTSEGLG